MTSARQVQSAPTLRGGRDDVVLVLEPRDPARLAERLAGGIAAAMSVSPADIVIERRRGAAPSIRRTDGKDVGGWTASFSDTAGALLGGAAPFPIGVDVEMIDPTFDWRTVAAEFFPEAQYAAWAALPPQEGCRAFFDAWVRWEACLKCRGQGFGGALIVPESAAQGLAVCSIDVGDGFAAAIALRATV